MSSDQLFSETVVRLPSRNGARSSVVNQTNRLFVRSALDADEVGQDRQRGPAEPGRTVNIGAMPLRLEVRQSCDGIRETPSLVTGIELAHWAARHT